MILLVLVVHCFGQLNNKCHGEQDEFRLCHPADCASSSCIDCKWSGWSEFTPCTCEGLQERHRTIATKNNACGKPCSGPKVTTQSCTPDCIEEIQDCELSSWTEWGTCDKSCDGGQQTRSRHIAQNARNHGIGCAGELRETQPCNMQKCNNADTCKLSTWSEWSKCSKTCNIGQQERSRRVTEPALYGGKPCNASLSQVMPCVMKEHCAGSVSCQWGEWGAWSTCSQTCGGGDKGRSRLIVVAPRNGGQLCEPKDMSEVVGCNTEPCQPKVDCELGEWTAWDACSCSCNGIRHRVRHITKYPEANGLSCIGPLREIDSCNHVACTPEVHVEKPVDCMLSPWADWTHCSQTCGPGTRTRMRTVMERPKHGGKPCSGELDIVEPCELITCQHKIDDHTDRDCVWSDWDQWGVCSVSCGGGEQIRHRSITTMACGRGKPCADQPSMEVKSCNTHQCGCEPCRWGAWSEWGACSCTGLKERHRAIETRSQSCGEPCEGPKVETYSCEVDCGVKPKDCFLSEWSSWSACTAECGGGQQEQTRTIMRAPSHGGHACEGYLKNIRPCGMDPCHQQQDCELSEWDPWSTCSLSCDGGQSFRSRRIKVNPDNGGRGCSGKLSEVRDCNNDYCEQVQDCEWGDWSDWSACSELCNGGQKTRTRQIRVSPKGGGKLCEPLPQSEMIPCNVQHCDANCRDARWSMWSAWSLCSASCGSSYQSRDRNLLTTASECGHGAEGLAQEFRKCVHVSCDRDVIDCELSPWTEWGTCSCTCNGMRVRGRHITLFPQKGGKECEGALKEMKPCGGNCAEEKPRDCELSSWSAWGSCSAKCGGGVKTRERHVTKEARNDGVPCEAVLREVGSCNPQACTHVTNCVWGEWNEWGACSVDCGGGQRNRYRHIDTMPAHGGQECVKGASAEVEECNLQTCGEVSFCIWGGWSGWSECSVVCGDGQQKRSRYLQVTHDKPQEAIGESEAYFPQGSSFTKSEQLGIVFMGGVLFSSLATVVFTRNGRQDAFRFQLASNPAE